MTGSNRMHRWWSAAEQTAASLTSPHADVARVDDEVATLVRQSTLMQACGSLASTWTRAWADSRTRRAVDPLVRETMRAPLVACIRMAGATVCVAAMTALALLAINHATDRSSLIVPAIIAAGGALAAAAAAPLARAIADRNR